MAGSVHSQGYVFVGIGRKLYPAHHLAFVIVDGQWPAFDVDHLNSQRSDNRWTNLRIAGRQVNNENIRRARKDNRSGVLGVKLMKNGKFAARLGMNKRVLHLGVFDTAEEAHEVYLLNKRELHRGNTL